MVSNKKKIPQIVHERNKSSWNILVGKFRGVANGQLSTNGSSECLNQAVLNNSKCVVIWY